MNLVTTISLFWRSHPSPSDCIWMNGSFSQTLCQMLKEVAGKFLAEVGAEKHEIRLAKGLRPHLANQIQTSCLCRSFAVEEKVFVQDLRWEDPTLWVEVPRGNRVD